MVFVGSIFVLSNDVGNWRRKRGSLIALVNFFLFAVFSVFYYIPFFVTNNETNDGYRRADFTGILICAIVANIEITNQWFLESENRPPWTYVQNLSLAFACKPSTIDSKAKVKYVYSVATVWWFLQFVDSMVRHSAFRQTLRSFVKHELPFGKVPKPSLHCCKCVHIRRLPGSVSAYLHNPVR